MKRLKEWNVRKVSWTQYWVVEESFFWLLRYDNPYGWIVTAEKNFVTNYGSIPRILRPFFDPTKYNSYVLHDAMYAHKVKYHQANKEYMLLTRKEADIILLEWIRYEWAWFLERLFIYLGVRIGWWIAWHFWKKIRHQDIKK